MRKVLVVEDELAIREFVVINLKKSGYIVTEADSGEMALKIFAENNGNFHAVLLDVMMPGVDGYYVCKEIRKANSNIGIIMLTAKTQEADKITGFAQGADDYITKPFSPSELVARVESLCRRVEMNTITRQDNSAERLTQGDFTLDIRRRILCKKDQVIELTQVEFQIMEYFFSNPGKELLREDILKRVWGEGYFGEEKIVDVNVRRLRMKIEDEASVPKHLLTVWGKGYKWQA